MKGGRSRTVRSGGGGVGGGESEGWSKRGIIRGGGVGGGDAEGAESEG
jgi:hypothetical protein